MKKLVSLLLTGILLASSPMTLAEEIVIKFSHVVSDDTPKGKGANMLRDLVKERLAGKVKIEVFPSSQLYTDKDVLKALLRNDVQLAAPSLSKFGRFTKKYGVFDLPFLFKDTAAVECFTAGPKGKELLKAADDKGFLGLAYWMNGMKQLSANNALIKPSDAKDKKFRVMSSDVLVAQFEAVNANPQKMAFSEVYNGLQSGLIDGQENTWSNMFSKKFFEVQKEISESNHGVLEYLVVTNAKFWGGLPADIRSELESIIAEVTTKVTAWALEKAEVDKKKITDSGKTHINTLSADDLALWQTAMKPVWAKFSNDIGQDSIDAAIACNK